MDTSSKLKTNAILLHFLIWTFWFGAPVLFSLIDTRQKPMFFQFVWYRMIFSLGLFYINYLFLIDRFLFKKRFKFFLIINLGLIGLSIACTEFIKYQLFVPDFAIRPDRPRPPVHFILSGMAFSYIFIITVSVAIRTTMYWFNMDNERRTLENENLRSELNNLKMQLNPHFFFNTLNNIYSLIQLSPEMAQESIHGLAKLMRYHLYETNSDKVPLQGEIDFLKKYISLMKLRTTDGIKVEFQCHIEHSSYMIAPLLFVPLIENAFKFGVNNDTSAMIKIDLLEKNHILSLHVENNVFIYSDIVLNKKGIGLENLQKRLRLIYPDRHQFKISNHNNRFQVNLIINL